MCVLAAKYFPNKGWVGCKNRDRNYTPEVSFKFKNKNDLEKLLFHDDMTGYQEGMNSHGVCILSASLMVQNDEKEIQKGEHDNSPDGRKINDALSEDTAVLAAKKCAANKLTGNTIIFDRDNLFLLEASISNNKYIFILRKIPKTEFVARTNHGIWLPWAGYQRNEKDEGQYLSRLSSEARLLQAQAIVNGSNDPEELIDGLCQVYLDNPQLNVMRHSTGRKKMRTTAQEMMIPSERTLYCRPISSHIEFDFWRFNKPNRNLWVELLSNRALYKDTKGDPPFINNGLVHR